MYKVFCCVAKKKNITKAANELMISQPAITQTIKKLEDQLGFKLFYRNSKGVDLTIYGEQLFLYINKSVDILSNSKQKLIDFDNGDNKIIKIGGGSTLLKYNAIDVLKKYKKHYPNIKIEVERGITSELLNRLENDDIDIVLCNSNEFNNDNIVLIPIESVNDIFVASSENFGDLKNKKYTLKEISQLPLILQSKVSSSRKYLDKLCIKNDIILDSKYELESYDLVLSFIKAGLGIGFINKNHVKHELETGDLFEIQIDFKIENRNIAVAINKKNANNKVILDFISIIKQ